MNYSFESILDSNLYDSTRVMFILGKYPWFNNMVVDTLKLKGFKEEDETEDGLSLEFGVTEDKESNLGFVDFNTFLDVKDTLSINGLWFCKCDYTSLSKAEKDKLWKYIKDPSEFGVLIIESMDWKNYREILKNRVLRTSQVCHSINLEFPSNRELKNIIKQYMSNNGIDIASNAIELFITKLNKDYDSYEEVLSNICLMHLDDGVVSEDVENKPLLYSEITEYLKGVQNYTVDDLMNRLVKPLGSKCSDKKKVVKIMMVLEQDIGSKQLVYKLLNLVNECIQYRLLINDGYIPIGINYFFKDVISSLPDTSKEKFKNISEWKFRSRAELASKTSLRDWQYISLILNKAIENVKLTDEILDIKCKKALYEVCTRSVLEEDTLNGILGIDDILYDGLKKVDRLRIKA